MRLATGSNVTVLDTSAAQRFGVGFGRPTYDFYAVGGVKPMDVVHVAKLRIGNLSSDGIDLDAVDMRTGDADPRLAGLLGMSILSHYDIDLDLAGGHVVLYEAKDGCHKPTVALAPNLYTARLQSAYLDQQAIVTVTINGHPFQALLDSGAPHSLMYFPAALRLGIDVSALHVPGHSVISGFGPAPVASIKHVFDNVVIGDLQISHLPISIIEQYCNGAGYEQTGTVIGGRTVYQAGLEQIVIGADIMQKIHFWVSHSSQTLVMQFPPLPSVLPK